MQMAGHGYLGLILMLLVATLAVSVHGQSSAGFLNIDCGKRQGYNYTDSYTGLYYVSDFDYINTGEIHQISPSLQNSGVYVESYDLRSFPNGTRNCYTLPVQMGSKYLIRTFFMYGNYDGSSSSPQFDLYLDTNLWFSIILANSSINYNYEILTVASANSTSVCLVNTGLGDPFISALELRPLPDAVYPEVNTSQSLALFSRINVQPTTDVIVRYPTDIYDRIWLPSSSTLWTRLTTTESVNTNNFYQPPSDVMSTAATPMNGSSLNTTWTWNMNSVGSSPKFFFAFHFAELQQLKANQSRMFDISWNDKYWTGPINPNYLTLTTVYSKNPGTFNTLALSIYKTGNSTLPPILNALEIYLVIPMTGIATNGGDADAIMNIKTLYQVKKNWMGDPCAPKTLVWDGVGCSYDPSNNANTRIIFLNLSSSGLSGGIPADLANLTVLQSLDLSNNSLSGSIPDFLANLSHLQLLNLSGNNFSGSIPKALQDRAVSEALQINTANNPQLCDNPSGCANNPEKSKGKIIAAVVIVGSIILIAAVVLIVVWKVRNGSKASGSSAVDTKKGKQVKSKGNSFRLPSFRSESRQFTFTELVTITSNFNTAIGKGGFGTVYYGVRENGLQVAVKLLSQTSSQGPKEFQRESQLLTRIHHKNLVPLVGYCNDSNHLALVYEYMAGGSLEGHLSGQATSSTELLWGERLRIAVEAAQGLEYLHKGCKPAIVHRDVKTSNILLNQNLEARIADFGLSKIFQNDAIIPVSTIVMGTPGYLDPEYYITNRLNEKSDVYSFGVVLLELITGQPAIIKREDNIHVSQWVQPSLETGEITHIVDPRLQGDYEINSVWKAMEIALACISSKVIQRPTMTEVTVLLKECLELETSKFLSLNTSRTTLDESRNATIEISPFQVSMISNPSAR